MTGGSSGAMVRAQVSDANMKYLSLVILIAQTTALVLLLRYSRTQSVEGPKYLSSTAVLNAEILKLITCLVMLFKEASWSLPHFQTLIRDECVHKYRDALKVAVPAFLYVVQNNLLFLALSKLDAATYQVTYQLKILTTALFAVAMLGQSLITGQWVALLLLTSGVALVQMPADSAASAASAASSSWSTDRLIGLAAVLASCVSSGFSGVYFEKILKFTKASIWMRNFQLAFFSIFSAAFAVFTYDSKAVSENGYFAGYSVLIWLVVLLQAYGGLLIGFVVKYADNILKGFAVSLSIVLSSLCSWFLLDDFTPSLYFAVGASLVIGATFLYGREQTKAPPPANPAYAPLGHSPSRQL